MSWWDLDIWVTCVAPFWQDDRSAYSQRPASHRYCMTMVIRTQSQTNFFFRCFPTLLSLLWKGGSLLFDMNANATVGIARFLLFKVSFPFRAPTGIPRNWWQMLMGYRYLSNGCSPIRTGWRSCIFSARLALHHSYTTIPRLSRHSHRFSNQTCPKLSSPHHCTHCCGDR
jgi:hypothetical protein